MNCIVCHFPIPEGLSECLECGTPASYSISDKESQLDDQEIAQSPASILATPQSHIARETLRNSGFSTNPFQETRSSRASFLTDKGFIFLGIIVITMIIAGSGLFLYLARSNNTPSAPSSLLSQTNSTRSTQSFTGTAPIPTSATIPDPYPPYSGTLLMNDSLRDNSGGFNWMDDSVSSNSENQGCRFTDGAYHVTNGGMTQSYMIYCVALDSSFSNFVYQIQATLLKGSDVGIVFRQSPHFKYYYFSIGQNGTYNLLWNNGDTSRILMSGVSSAIHQGLNQPNILAVVANGTTLDLYVNKKHLTSVIDNAYAGGRIGTAVQSDDGSASDAAFTHLMLWA